MLFKQVTEAGKLTKVEVTVCQEENIVGELWRVWAHGNKLISEESRSLIAQIVVVDLTVAPKLLGVHIQLNFVSD
jgi:hypothetical protein